MRAAHPRVTEFVGMARGALRPGVFAPLGATILMIGAAATRSSETERPRTPPGTI